MNSYKEIFDLVNDNKKEDVYSALMTKEAAVLDTVNRIVQKKENSSYSNFMDLSLFDIITNFAIVWKRIYQEVVIFKQRDIIALFYENDRKIYVGIMLVMIALFLYFIDVSR